MFPKTPALAMAASLALVGSTASAEQAATRPPLAKPGDTYVSLKVDGCANKCPSFEIYVFEDGKMTFRSNNQYTTAKGTQYKNGMGDTYNKISKYLQESGAFNGQADCAEKNAGTSTASRRFSADMGPRRNRPRSTRRAKEGWTATSPVRVQAYNRPFITTDVMDGSRQTA